MAETVRITIPSQVIVNAHTSMTAAGPDPAPAHEADFNRPAATQAPVTAITPSSVPR
jgi:hypothetical protein